MLLCLDCGNTRIKWGLRETDCWRGSGAVPTAAPDRLLEALAPYAPPTRAIACNVAGIALQSTLSALLPCAVHWNVAQAEQCGVRNGYEQPAQLGADRWAALLGARALHRGPCLVVNAGTATTVDVLDGAGDFLGGLILPGLDLMRQALAANTAQLPAAAGDYSERPRNTRDAIASGVLYATLGAIERMFRSLPLGAGAVCIVAGGAAPQLLPHLGLPSRSEPQLVLEGLARVAETMPW